MERHFRRTAESREIAPSVKHLLPRRLPACRIALICSLHDGTEIPGFFYSCTYHILLTHTSTPKVLYAVTKKQRHMVQFLSHIALRRLNDNLEHRSSPRSMCRKGILKSLNCHRIFHLSTPSSAYDDHFTFPLMRTHIFSPPKPRPKQCLCSSLQ